MKKTLGLLAAAAFLMCAVVFGPTATDGATDSATDKPEPNKRYEKPGFTMEPPEVELISVGDPHPETQYSQLELIIQQERLVHDVHVVAVAIVRDGQLAYSKGFGRTCPELKAPLVDGKTLFRIGEVTQLLTAAATLRLVEEGDVDHRRADRSLHSGAQKE